MQNKYEECLLEFGYNEGFSLEKRTYVGDISFIKLRDGLLRVGDILKEDMDNMIYVVSVKAGIFNKNHAVIICGLENGKVTMIAFAREGLVKQNTCKKAMDKIEESIR
ncbi:MAG: hypothetical protein SPF99_00185 [Anaerobutyricum sp.]|nr:hypothetical protein [Anaerobutyricum sp.]